MCCLYGKTWCNRKNYNQIMVVEKRFWEEVIGYVSENKVDKRWTLRSNVDDKAHGSLRIVSHPDLKPGHLRAFISLVTSRKGKTKKEITKLMEKYKIEQHELEAYSIDEDIITIDNTYSDRYQELETMFGVEIFKRKKK